MDTSKQNWIWTAEGEANQYFVVKDKKTWLASIKLNGVFSTSDQETIMNILTAAPQLIEALKHANQCFNDHFGITDNDDGGNSTHDIIRAALKTAIQ